MEHVAAADRAFVDEDYDEAVKLYSKALESAASLGGEYNPSRVYEARAFAHIKLEQWMEAVQDATKAVELDPSNAKAYLRKGTACYQLEEYETALQSLEKGQQLAPDNTQFRNWIKKCRDALAEEGVSIPTATAATASAAPAAPAPPTPAAAAPPAPAKPVDQPAPAPTAVTQAAAPPAQAEAAAPQGAPAAAAAGSKALAPAAPDEFVGKYRHQWYQLGTKVVVDVYAKNLPKDAVSVQLTGANNDHLRICIAAQPSSSAAAEQQASSSTAAAADTEDYVLELDLFNKVSAEVPVKVEVLRTKVEVTLVKADPNVHWATLGKGAKGPVAAGVSATAVVQEQGQQQGPPRAYPSSKGPKDWSKFDAEVKQLEEKGELEDGDPLNSFFKKIFAQGDEDTRRAMMKSFVESNGTVLSTNWKEVGAKKIECTPPEGMELHKWRE